jgi:hypothetical protein
LLAGGDEELALPDEVGGGDEVVALPDEVGRGVEVWVAGAARWAGCFALCAAGFALALAIAATAPAAAAWVAVVAEVLVVGGADGVAGAVEAAGVEPGLAMGLTPAGAVELPEPPVNTSTSSISASSPRSTSVHLRQPNREERRRGRDAAPIRAATPLRSAPPIRPAARLRARGPAAALPSARFGRSPRRMARAEGRPDLVVPRLGRDDLDAADAWLIGVPAIRPLPAPTDDAGGSGCGAGISVTNTGADGGGTSEGGRVSSTGFGAGSAIARGVLAARVDFGRCVTAVGVKPRGSACRLAPLCRGGGSPVASAILASRTASSSGERCGLGEFRSRPFRGS